MKLKKKKKKKRERERKREGWLRRHLQDFKVIRDCNTYAGLDQMGPLLRANAAPFSGKQRSCVLRRWCSLFFPPFAHIYAQANLGSTCISPQVRIDFSRYLVRQTIASFLSPPPAPSVCRLCFGERKEPCEDATM